MSDLQTELTHQIGAAKHTQEQVERNQKENDDKLKELNKQLKELDKQLSESKKQIGDLNKEITYMDDLLIKHNVHEKEQRAKDLEKALEIEIKLSDQPEKTRLDFSVGGKGWTKYLEVKNRNISTDEKRQQLFNNCNCQYDASQQSVDNKWGVLCIGTSHDDKSIKSLEKKCKENV